MHTVMLPDLRGYNDFGKPDYSPDNRDYPFCAMAHCGHVRFVVAGNDRRDRLVHRTLLDHSGAVLKASVLDMAPTLTMYDDTSQNYKTMSDYLKGAGQHDDRGSTY